MFKQMSNFDQRDNPILLSPEKSPISLFWCNHLLTDNKQNGYRLGAFISR